MQYLLLYFDHLRIQTQHNDLMIQVDNLMIIHSAA